MKFIMAYSGGKDCTLCLDRLIRQGHEPVALFTTVTRRGFNYNHGISTLSPGRPVVTIMPVFLVGMICYFCFKEERKLLEQSIQASGNPFGTEIGKSIVLADVKDSIFDINNKMFE